MTSARRGLIFATVIVACAGSGYLASCLWPMRAPVAPAPKAASAEWKDLKEADRARQSIEVRSAALAPGEQPQLAPEHETTDATERPLHAARVHTGAKAVEHPHQVEQTIERPAVRGPTAEARHPPAPVPRTDERRSLPRQTAPRRERQPAEAKLPQPSPKAAAGPQRDAAMRDFMSPNPPFRY
jgi:hypothetical protein